MKRTCKQCGKDFELSQSEINFYKEKNLELPKRCKDCRDANKRTNKTITPSQPHISSHNEVKTYQQNKAGTSTLTKLLTLAGIILFAVFGAWSYFSGNADNSTLSGNANRYENSTYTNTDSSELHFRNDTLLNEHYQKHGIEMGFSSASAYEAAARSVVENRDALHKTEAEDGDDVYYVESTNEFVIVSTDGYIRTYFKPNDGIAYYNRQ